MPIRAPILLMGLLLIGSACTSEQPLAPAAPRATRLARVVALTEQGSDREPVDALMGDDASGAVQVASLSADGARLSGALIEFRVHTTDARGEQPDTRVVQADADGVARLETRFPMRDTTAYVARIEARMLSTPGAPLTDTSAVVFVARARRNLTEFGGASAAVFSALPIALARISGILPLGTLGGDDALPSADAIVESATPTNVVAMADGLITEIDVRSQTLTMRVRDQVRVRMSGFALSPSLWVGRVVRAGEPLGTFAPNSTTSGIAVRVLDAAIRRQNWVRPERYGARATVGFFARYLADSIRSHAFALVRRGAPDLEGRIDYDRDGRLIGTWFSQSALDAQSALRAAEPSIAASRFSSVLSSELDPSSEIGSSAVSFVYDAVQPGQIRVAIGSSLATQLGARGVRAVSWDDRDPAQTDVASGLVRYHLYRTDDATRIGQADAVLLVQLLDAQTLRVEIVPASGSDRATFSARSTILTR